MGETVFGWWGDPDPCQGLRLESEPIAHLIETHGVGELREKHRREVTDHGEGA